MTLTKTCKVEVTNNSFLNRSNEIISLQQGGAITTFQSNIFLNGECTLFDNHAVNGGALHATESRLFVHGELVIANNTATQSGGGIYLYQSELNCEDNGTLKLLSLIHI